MIPNKAYHALACGAPLITADTPAARELLRDEENALLVPPGDPAALAEAMRRLAADPELAPCPEPRRAGRLRGAGERGGARRPLAVAARRAPRVRPRPKVLLWTANGRVRRRVRRRSRSSSTGRTTPGASTSGTWRRRSGRRRTATRSRSRTSRASRPRGSVRMSTRSSPRSRRCGGSGRARRCSSRRRRWRSRSARCPSSGWPGSTSAPSRPRSGSRSRTSCTRPSSG